jgi:hypothetical protein
MFFVFLLGFSFRFAFFAVVNFRELVDALVDALIDVPHQSPRPTTKNEVIDLLRNAMNSRISADVLLKQLKDKVAKRTAIGTNGTS